MAGIMIGCKQNIVITTGFEEDELLKISGDAVKFNEAVILLLSAKDSYDRGFDAEFWEIKYENRTMLDYFKDQVKEEIIRVNVLAAFAKSKNVSLSEEEQLMIDTASKKFMETADKEVIEEYGISKKNVSALMEKLVLSEKVYEKVISDYEIEISDEEARVMYVNYITLDAKAEKAMDIASEILGKVTAGNELKAVAEKYDYATYTEGYLSRLNFDEEQSNLLFKLKDGEVSSIIESKGKLYIIKCINDYDENMTDSNKSVLIEYKKTEEFDKEYQPFEKSTNVEFNTELWDEFSLTKNQKPLGVNVYDILEEAGQQ